MKRDARGRFTHELTLPKPPRPEIKCDECGTYAELRRERDVFGQPFWLCGPCFNHNKQALIPPRDEQKHPIPEFGSMFAARLLDDYDPEENRVRNA